MKKVDGKPQPGFVLYVNGCERQGKEAMGREVGTISADKIPEFLVKLGKIVSESGLEFNEWNRINKSALDEIAIEYTS